MRSPIRSIVVAGTPSSVTARFGSSKIRSTCSPSAGLDLGRRSDLLRYALSHSDELLSDSAQGASPWAAVASKSVRESEIKNAGRSTRMGSVRRG